MSKEQNSSYVMKEGISHSERQKNNHEGNNSWEILMSFNHKVSHLDAMIKKVNSIDNNSIKNTDTVNILNTLLHKKGFGGSNGWTENKAYFKKHGDHIVLVLNTVVNGEEVSSMKDIEKVNALLVNVDKLLIENPVNTAISIEKKGPTGEEKIQSAGKRLAHYERQIQEMNSEYRENTNDGYMALDFALDTIWLQWRKQIYEECVRSIQKNIEEDYRKLLISFAGKDLTVDEKKKLNFYGKRVENLLWKKLEDVQSFAGYFITEKKLDSLKNAGYAIMGIGEGAFEAFTGTIVFAFLLTTEPELRNAVCSSIGSFYTYLTKNCTNRDKLWGDFCTMLDKEIGNFQNLPEEQKAKAIGKITGNIMATILGAKGMSTAIKSGKLRLKFKVPEEIVPVKAPKIFKTAEKTQDSAKSSLKKSKKKVDVTEEVKAPKKTIANIGEVKNWADLESFVSTVDRVRFKEWLTGKVMQEIINEVKQGTRSIKDIPDYGWIRKVVDKLVKSWWDDLLDAVGMEKRIQTVGKTIGKWIESIHDIMPFKDVQKILHKNILTGYDHIDIWITKLRTLTSDKAMLWMNMAARMAHIKEVKEITVNTIESIQAVSFPGKNTLLNILKGMNSSLISLKESFIRWDEIVVHNSSSRLTKREFQALRFEEGLAIREIERDGKILYEYRNAKGEKVFKEYTYASHFKDGKAAVTEITQDGKELNYMIDKTGKTISAEIPDASFGSIQRFENGGYRVFDGEDYRIKYTADHANKKSQKYSFMTEIQWDMVIGIDKKNGVKYIIDSDGNRFKTPFHYVDDFTEEGVAAVKNKIPDGKWLLIDKEGNLLGKDGMKISANGEIFKIINNVRVTLNENGRKGKKKQFDQKMAELAREEMFKEWYEENLDALKAHTDERYKNNDPEVVMKIEAKATTLLKKNNIIITPDSAFIHTKQDGILLFQDAHGTKIINIEKGTVSEKSFSYIHTPDINNGFIRVAPENNENYMGVVDLNGKYIIDPEYIDIQILDDKKRLFKVFEMREIGTKLKDGNIIHHDWKETAIDGMVKRIGLTDGRGKIIIETGYTEITQSNDVMAQGLVRGENYEILQKSKKRNIQKFSSDTTNVWSRTSDTVSMMVIAAVESPAVIEKAGRGSLNIIRTETSTVISELRNDNLSLLINGTLQTNKEFPLQIQNFLRNKIPTIQDIWTLEGEIEKIVHEESRETIRKYLEGNGLHKLTKAERIEVANYETETREKLIGAIRIQVQNEQVIFRNGKIGQGRENFVNTLVNNLHPDLYEAIGGITKGLDKMEKAA